MAINQSKSDKTMYKSLTHYLFNKLAEGQMWGEDFDVFNLFSWYCAIGIGLGILAFGGVIVLHNEVQIIVSGGDFAYSCS